MLTDAVPNEVTESVSLPADVNDDSGRLESIKMVPLTTDTDGTCATECDSGDWSAQVTQQYVPVVKQKLDAGDVINASCCTTNDAVLDDVHKTQSHVQSVVLLEALNLTRVKRKYNVEVNTDAVRGHFHSDANSSDITNDLHSSGSHYKKLYMCTVCDRRFLRRGLFKDHMEKHTGVKHYSCPNCDERFSTFTLLRLHINSHGSKYKCDQCGKCFAQSQGLKTHRRSHSGERPFVCATCSKRFTTSFNLARHSRIHSGVKPYVCHMCNRQFRTSGNLHRHMKVHDGEELSQCLVCCCFHPASMMHTTPLQSI